MLIFLRLIKLHENIIYHEHIINKFLIVNSHHENMFLFKIEILANLKNNSTCESLNAGIKMSWTIY